MSNALLSTGLWGDLFRDEAVAQHFSAASMLAQFCAFERAWTESLMATGAVSEAHGRAALADLIAVHRRAFATGQQGRGYRRGEHQELLGHRGHRLAPLMAGSATPVSG